MFVDPVSGEPIDDPPPIVEKGRPVRGDVFIGEARDVDWAVRDRIAGAGLTIFAGQPKIARKSMLALHLVQCVARGQPWLGQPVGRRPAIFIGFEGGRSFLALRAREVGHVITPPGEIEPPIGYGYGMDYYEWCIARIRRAAQTGVPWPVLIVVDTLSQVLAIKAVDENSNPATTNFLREHDDLCSVAGTALVWIHHFSKLHQQPRGASAITALCNTCEIHQIRLDTRQAIAAQTDLPERGEAVLRLDWKLRQSPSATDVVRIAKPNGMFSFDPIPLRDLPRSALAPDRPSQIREAIAAFVHDRPGQIVTLSSLISAAAGTMIGRPPGKHAILKAIQEITNSGTELRTVRNQGEPAWIWPTSDEPPAAP